MPAPATPVPTAPARLSPLEHFAKLPDPRGERTRRHPLPELLFIALCASVAGADSFVEFEEWGLARLDWLRQYTPLREGIPSHDTFARVFAKLDPVRFGACFLDWVAALRCRKDPVEGAADSGRSVIATDGKALRRSFDRASGQSALHLVSAWAVAERLVLGQVAVEAKSNEITALPELLGLLDLDGAVVTADAMGCQKQVAATIVAGGGDYVLALKGNQGTLHADVREYLDAVAAGALSDPAFREDECRVRTDHAPQNLATLRHLALNLLRQERTARVGVKARRMKAAWEPAYLGRVVFI